MSEKMIFCLGDGKNKSSGDGFQKNNRVFNKQVSEERFEEVRQLLVNDILQDLKLGNKNSWEDALKKVTKEQWKRIAEIPEFDKEVVEGIIGFELALDN